MLFTMTSALNSQTSSNISEMMSFNAIPHVSYLGMYQSIQIPFLLIKPRSHVKCDPPHIVSGPNAAGMATSSRNQTSDPQANTALYINRKPLNQIKHKHTAPCKQWKQLLHISEKFTVICTHVHLWTDYCYTRDSSLTLTFTGSINVI